MSGLSVSGRFMGHFLFLHEKERPSTVIGTYRQSDFFVCLHHNRIVILALRISCPKPVISGLCVCSVHAPQPSCGGGGCWAGSVECVCDNRAEHGGGCSV